MPPLPSDAERPAEPQLPNEESELSANMAAFRRDIGSRIQPHIEEFAHIIRLAHATPQFEHDVVEAVHRCILGAALPGKRNSALRKDLLESGRAEQQKRAWVACELHTKACRRKTKIHSDNH